MNEMHIDSVNKKFGNHSLLNDIFISCKPGQVIGLLGKNGSGKSTLLKIIAGIAGTDNKFIKINNRPIVSLSDSRNLVKYLPQDGFLPGHLKIKSIISLFCGAHERQSIYAHDFIEKHKNSFPRQLSGGERRIIEVALMVYSSSQYLLFDEPFNGLDPLHVDLIKSLIRNCAANKGIIVTDHDYKNVLSIASQIILLRDGATKIIKHNTELVELGYLPICNL